MALITPVILAGGVGSRLWPLSREDRPKQFLPLVSERSMLQETLLRLQEDELFAAPAIVCHERYVETTLEQAQEIDVALSALIAEPLARNSGPAIAAASAYFAAQDPEALLLISPADHLIADPQNFHDCARAARDVALKGKLTTFGVSPTRPETGYGYIRAGEPLEGCAGFELAAFVEKPDIQTARSYLASGDYSWNSGMFLFRAQDMLSELERLQPQMSEASSEAVARARFETKNGCQAVLHLEAEAFSQAPEDSIDYAVMEKTDRAAVVVAQFEWSDIGSWETLAEHAPKDNHGVTRMGPTHMIDCARSYCRSEGPFVTAIGVEDLVIVATPDAVLVTRTTTCQKAKQAFKAHQEFIEATQD